MENIAINFIILAVTSHFSRIRASTARLFSGAIVGAAYVIAAFLPGFHIYFTLLAKLILSMVIIAVTFWPEKIVEFLRLTVIFYLVSFVFGGAAFGLFYLFSTGDVLYNGVFYINNFPLKTLIVAITVAYIVIKLSWDFVRIRITRDNMTVPVSIRYEEMTVSVKGLIDTGNSLKDPISDLPVIVVEYTAMKELLPQEISELFLQRREDDLELVSEVVGSTSWANRFRIIPFSSLGKENGMLIGFKPDTLVVGDEDAKKYYQDVIVGIYNRNLTRDKSYEALLGLELVG